MLTLPNMLTLSRIFAIPLLAWFLWWPGWETGFLLAFGLYCLMGITDYFDGYLARTSGTVSKLGIFLDPIADKIMVAAVILVLAAQGVLRGPYVGDMHVVAGLIILMREIAVSGLREFLGPLQVSVPVSRLAKWKTTCLLYPPDAAGDLEGGDARGRWHTKKKNRGLPAQVPQRSSEVTSK